jgi:hypothetical protein
VVAVEARSVYDFGEDLTPPVAAAVPQAVNRRRNAVCVETKEVQAGVPDCCALPFFSPLNGDEGRC